MLWRLLGFPVELIVVVRALARANRRSFAGQLVAIVEEHLVVVAWLSCRAQEALEAQEAAQWRNQVNAPSLR
jgi:hypothetical protein